MLKVYTYAGCSTCKKAVKFLRDLGQSFTELPIREQPPSQEELQAMLKAQGGELRRLFNTSGQDYRALGLGTKIGALSEKEALEMLQTNGNLVKRPFVVGEGVHLVGFNETAWQTAFPSA